MLFAIFFLFLVHLILFTNEKDDGASKSYRAHNARNWVSSIWMWKRSARVCNFNWWIYLCFERYNDRVSARANGFLPFEFVVGIFDFNLTKFRSDAEIQKRKKLKNINEREFHRMIRHNNSFRSP